MEAEPKFLQGVFHYDGLGLQVPIPIGDGLSYIVPPGARAQPVYLRAGNSGGELICLLLLRDDQPIRYFPIGAKADTHVSLRIVENAASGSELELRLAAPSASSGSVVIDFGIMEIP